jgi:outer membrane protein assembly factor BamB
MTKMRRIPAMMLAAMFISGCTTLSNLVSDEDNIEPPTPLAEFEPQFEVETLWQQRVGSGIGDRYLKLKPAVAGDRVIAADRKGRVRAFEAKSGTPLWQTKIEKPISAGPSVGEELVLLGTYDGDVVALSPEDGSPVWQAQVSSEILSAPKSAQGTVVVRTVDGKLYALDATDGTRLWVYDRSVPALTLRGTSAPVIARDIVIAGLDNGRVVALALDSGQPLWETPIVQPHGRSELERMVDIDAEPVVVRDTVYVVTFQGRTAALDLYSGEVLWQRDIASYAGLSVADRTLYITDAQSHIWALNRYNSASLWHQDKLHARGVTAPVDFLDFVVVGDFEGYLHWLRSEDGALVARTRVDKKGILARPVSADDTLYVYGQGGTLAALRMQ